MRFLSWQEWRKRWKGWTIPSKSSVVGVLVAILCLAVGFVFYYCPRNPQSNLNGVLTPAAKESPSNPCQTVPAGYFSVYLGDSVAFARQFPYNVITIGKEEVLSLERTQAGIAVNATLRSEDGRVITQILRNEFHINPNNYFRLERPDGHTLVVYDQYGQESLNIQYMNRSAMRLTGIFFYPGRSPVRIEEHSMTVGGNVFYRACFGRGSGAIKIQ